MTISHKKTFCHKYLASVICIILYTIIILIKITLLSTFKTPIP